MLRCLGGEVGCKICGHSLESIPHYFGIGQRLLIFGVDVLDCGNMRCEWESCMGVLTRAEVQGKAGRNS